MGFTFEAVVPDVSDESAFFDVNDVEGSIRRLAAAKAQSVAAGNPGAIVLGADTIVFGGGRILGKPRDADEARSMLAMLRGRPHIVFSGIALICGDARFSESAVEKTTVIFRDFDDDELSEYIGSASYLDKAGAYAIQENAMTFISRIEGCYYNVVGLPIEKTISLFKAYLTHTKDKTL
jgi:septum formation protein